MKTYLDCIPCVLRQALEASRLSTDDEKVQREVLDKVMLFLIEADQNLTPPHIARHIFKIIRDTANCEDPYCEIKIKYNNIALKMYSNLKKTIKESSDEILTAVRMAIAGNIIDFGVGNKFDLDATLKEALIKEFAIYNYDLFLDSLKSAKTLLYLGDNAGEIVFDKILIETIKKTHELKVYYAVKSIPVINDATMKDANDVKMKEVAEVIPNGSDAPGTILSLCSDDFLRIYNDAQMIVSKGQGNYETLSEEHKKNIFFLLKVKCSLIAAHLGVKVGDIVLK